jgi:hypothetical protein
MIDPTPRTPAANPTIGVGRQSPTPVIGDRSLAVGDEAPVLTHELKRSDLIRYAGASGDFFPCTPTTRTPVTRGSTESLRTACTQRAYW